MKFLSMLVLGAAFSCSPNPALAREHVKMIVPAAAPADVHCYFMPSGVTQHFMAFSQRDGRITSTPIRRLATAAELRDPFIIRAIEKDRWNVRHRRTTYAVPVSCVRAPA